MPKRIKFGGSSEIYLDQHAHAPSLVGPSTSEHDGRNPGHIRNSGLGSGVAYRQRIPDSALRELTFNANADQRELHEELHPYSQDGSDIGIDKINQKYLPGAMGAYSARGTLRRGTVDDDRGEIEEDPAAYSGEDDSSEDEDDLNEHDEDVRKGFQIFLSSSSKHARKAEGCAAELAPRLRSEVVHADSLLPDHRTGWHCAEQGIVSDHRDANPDRSVDGEDDNDEDRVFVVDPLGNHIASCGHDTDKYGCEDFCRAIRARDVGDYEVLEHEDESSSSEEEDNGSDNEGTYQVKTGNQDDSHDSDDDTSTDSETARDMDDEELDSDLDIDPEILEVRSNSSVDSEDASDVEDEDENETPAAIEEEEVSSDDDENVSSDSSDDEEAMDGVVEAEDDEDDSD